MKVLHLGFPNLAMSKAFMAKSSSYRFIDWTAWTAIPNNVHNLHSHILDVCSEFVPDLIFMQIQSPGVITPELVSKLPGLIINWTWDFREDTPEWMVDVAPYVISTFTNERDVNYIRSLGYSAEFLQGGFDPEVYDPEGDSLDNCPEIVFMANNYPKDEHCFPLADYRMAVVEKLKERYGDRFGVYGFGWPGQNPLQSFMHRERKEAACYRSAKIAINLSHFVSERYTSDRMFRILGSGIMCLSHYYPGIDKDFIDGVHLRVWHDIDELVELIDRYVQDVNGDRITISEAGCKLAHFNYTWSNMVEHIVALCANKV